jgi:hypothetical protein
MQQERESQEFADSAGLALSGMLAAPIVLKVLLQQLTAFAVLLHEEHISLPDVAEQQQQQPAVSGQSSSSSSSQPAEPARGQPSKRRFSADLREVHTFHLDVPQLLRELASKAYWDAARFSYSGCSAEEKWLLCCKHALRMVNAADALAQFRCWIHARSSQQQSNTWQRWLFSAEGTKVVLQLQLLAAAFVQRQRRQGAVLDAAGPAAELLLSCNRLLHNVILGFWQCRLPGLPRMLLQ